MVTPLNTNNKNVPIEIPTVSPVTIPDRGTGSSPPSTFILPKFKDIKPDVVTPSAPPAPLGSIKAGTKILEEEEPKLTEEDLRNDPEFLQDARTIWENEHDKKWVGSNTKLGDEGLERQSRVGWNLGYAGLVAYNAGDWTPEVQEAWHRNMEKYRRAGITPRSVADALYFSVVDVAALPLWLGSPALRLAGALGSKKAAQTAIRFSVQKSIENNLLQQISKKLGAETVQKLSMPAQKKLIAKAGTILGPKAIVEARKKEIWKLALPWQTGGRSFKNALQIWAPTGAVYSGLFDLAHQNIEAGERLGFSDYDWQRFGFSTMIGAGFGLGLGYLLPVGIERLGRSRAIRKLQEQDTARTLLDVPESYGLIEQSKRLANEAHDNTLSRDSSAIRVAEDVIQELNVQGIEPEVHSFGSGIFTKANKAMADEFNISEGTIIIPEKERLKSTTTLDGKTKNVKNVTTEELPINVAKAENLGLDGMYANPNELLNENKDILVASNIFGRYDSPTLVEAVIDQNIKSLKPDGIFIANIGPRRQKNLAHFESKELLNRYDPKEGKIKLIGDEKARDIIEEIVPPSDKQGIEVLQREGAKHIKLKELTGMNLDKLLPILADKFKDIEIRIKNKKPVIVAKNKITFTPEINISIPPSKQGRFKNAFHTIFKFTGLNPEKVGNWWKSSMNLPAPIVNRMQKMKSSDRAILINVDTQTRKLNTLLNAQEINGIRWNKLSNVKQKELLKRVNIYLFNKQEPDPITGESINTPGLIKSIPEPIRRQLDSMSGNIIEIQKMLLPKTKNNPLGISEKGYVSGGVLQAEMIQQTMGKKKNITLYFNEQYELFDNPDWINRILKPNKDYYINIVKNAKEFFRREFLRDDLLQKTYFEEGIPHSKFTKGEFSSLQQEYRYLNGLRTLEAGTNNKVKVLDSHQRERLEQIETGVIDDIFNMFLKRHSAEEILDIRRLGLQGFAMNNPPGSSPIKGIFYKKKNLPPALKELMGAHEEPMANYANTMVKLFRTAENYKFEREVAELAKRNKFPDVFVPVEKGEVPLDPKATESLIEASRLQKSDIIDPLENIVEGKFDQPFKGIRATEAVADAIQHGNELKPLENRFFKTFLLGQALTRISKTAYSLAAIPRNFLSAQMKAFAAGNLNIQNLRVLPKVFAALRSKKSPELAADIMKLQYLNIYGSGVKAASLRDALGETIDTNWFLDINKMLKFGDDVSTRTKTKRLLLNFNKGLLDLYQSMDDIWKWYSFLNERQNYKQVLIDKGQDPNRIIDRFNSGGVYTSGPNKGKPIMVEISLLDDFAGQMTRAHMDNYGEVARIFKAARRFPTADFLAYKTEQLRTTYNIVETAFKDIQEGKEQQSLGQRRADGRLKGTHQLMLGYKRLGSIISAVGASTALMKYKLDNYVIGQDENEEPVTLGDEAIVTIGDTEYSLNKTRMDAIRDAFLPVFMEGQEFIPYDGANFLEKAVTDKDNPALQPVSTKNKDGEYEIRDWIKEGFPVFNLSYIEPWAPWREVLYSLLRNMKGSDKSWQEQLKGARDSLGRAAYNNFGPSMFAKGIYEAAMGVNQFGHSLAPDAKGNIDLLQRLERIWIAFKPGVVKHIEGIASAARGEPTRGGFGQDVTLSFQKSVGIPAGLIEPAKALPFKLQSHLKDLRKALQPLKKLRRQIIPGTETEIINHYVEGLEAQKEAVNEITRIALNAMAAGMDINNIHASLTKEGHVTSGTPAFKLIVRSINTGQFFPDGPHEGHADLVIYKRYLEETYPNLKKHPDVLDQLTKIWLTYMGQELPVFTAIKKQFEEEEE